MNTYNLQWSIAETATMDRIDSMRAFVSSVDRGSLASAARRLERSPATVTRAIAMLEKRLGTRLMHRACSLAETSSAITTDPAPKEKGKLGTTPPKPPPTARKCLNALTSRAKNGRTQGLTAQPRLGLVVSGACFGSMQFEVA